MSMRMSTEVKFAPSIEIGKFLSPVYGFQSIWEFGVFRDEILIDYAWAPNVTYYQGINHNLEVAFAGAATQVNPWYILIFEDNYTPLVTDTYAVPGFTECQAYTEAARQAFVESAPASQSTNNDANQATFAINATKTIYGGALTSVVTMGDTVAAGGVMFAGANFGGRAVVNLDTFKVKITITGYSV